jgi:GTP-binding protein EngB required for normal cell division
MTDSSDPRPTPVASRAQALAGDRVTTPLNENQVRRVLSTFSHVEDLLKHVEALCHPDPSPFARERPNLSQEEARLLVSFVVVARKRMLAALDRLGIPRPEQAISARRSVSTALLFAEIDFSELEARSLRGYGAMDPRAGEEITALSADLQALMRRGVALLREQEEGGLVEQVAKLPGPVGEVLRKLLALSTSHGLTELRPLIAAAAERASATTLDVGVFGRVSSGKSSLINALVGQTVLPVGATPVTAVPVRIGKGALAVEVRLREGGARQIGLEDLPAFATEDKNPQNRRGVRSIEISLPSAPEGLRFLDTPGVGSLTSSGSAQAFAWLPRCDLGLVLVAAGTPVGRDETALVSGLRHAGISCSVLLSKADLLDDAETEQALAYIRTELQPSLGPSNPVDLGAVSTRPGATSGLDRLRMEVLRPLADDHVERSTAALRTRLRRLIALAAAGLDGSPSPNDASAVEFEKRRGAAAEAVGRVTDSLARSARGLLEELADGASAAWGRGEDAAACVRSAILAAVSRSLSAVREAVDALQARANAAADGRRLPPLFDPEFLDAIKALPPPRLAPGFARRAMARRATAPLLPFLDESLHRYAERLRAWGEGALKETHADREAWTAVPIRNAELAALDTLVSDVGVGGDHLTSQERPASARPG